MGQPHTGPRCSIHRNEANTTTYNSNFPTQQSQKVTLLPTRFVHPPSWLTPATTPTFPHQQAEKSPQNQHVLSFNPKNPTSTSARLPEGQAAMPVGGGRAWPDNEPTRRAKLAARTAGGRAAAHGHTKQPSRDSGRVQSPARGTRSHVRPQLGTPRPTARSPAHSAQASYIDESAHPCRGGRF